MTIKPNSGTVNVSRELLPCPFCGGNSEVLDHADDCYFTLAAQLKTSSASDCSLAPAVLRAWNNRAQPADQQGEPVMKLEAEKLWGGDGEYAVSFVKPGWLKECREKGGTFLLYTQAQPATAKVVLPERLDIPHRGEFESANQHAAAVGEAKSYNACLDEVSKLNGIET